MGFRVERLIDASGATYLELLDGEAGIKPALRMGVGRGDKDADEGHAAVFAAQSDVWYDEDEGGWWKGESISSTMIRPSVGQDFHDQLPPTFQLFTMTCVGVQSH